MGQSIKHNPIFETDKICDYYSKKDGVKVTYVCTSAVNEYDAYAVDIFYRDSPHPEFGNKYFGIYSRNNLKYIVNADNIENLYFYCVKNKGVWKYSQHRHDFRDVGRVSIDGGRAYFRLVGNIDVPTKTFKVVNGVFRKRDKQ